MSSGGCFVFSGGERDVVFSAVGKGVFFSRENEAWLLARGRGVFWDFGNWLFSAGGREKSRFPTGREGFLLLTGGKRVAPPSFLSFGDVSFSR